MREPTLAQSVIHSIVHGQHRDVFSVLGLHTAPGGKGIVIRAFLPQAQTVEVLERATGKKLVALDRVHDEGLFEAELRQRRQRFDYCLRIDGVAVVEDPYRFAAWINPHDAYLFNEGTQEYAYRFLGARGARIEGVDGVVFAVWAPAAARVSVVGEFNAWDGRRHVMRRHPASGIWEIFIPGIGQYALYKYEIVDAHGHVLPLRADPYARSMQHPPQTASRVVLDDAFAWGDGEWMAQRAAQQPYRDAIAIYEVHPGSWRRQADDGNRYLSYRELADELIPYVLDMGFTHIQLMPVSEYPFDGSWGYQPVGMFAPSIRFGTPDEFRHFVDACHQRGIGVLLDWVPGHFPTDAHGLGKFDGSCLYEHADVRKGFHPDWNTLIYNYGRAEVVSFLLSNANYWLEEFHLDGLRVDAVASMLYLDYSRKAGEWIPNEFGGRENLEAIRFLQTVNARVYARHPGVMMIAEESTSWPGVSRAVDAGGLGFGFKWNMGWMNDTLRYIRRDPIHRPYHHDEITFSFVYAWSENFMLPLSHDEVVHGKGSLLGKMPGDDWQKFANLRALYGYMWAHPGKKLLFMGGEFAQRREWNHDTGLDWHLLQEPAHAGVQKLVRDLNHFYRDTPALHRSDCDPDGFAWLSLKDWGNSIFAWLRRTRDDDRVVVVVINMTPQTHRHYRLGVPHGGVYRERINTDAREYGGSGQGNAGQVLADAHALDGQPCSISITVPPLSTLYLECCG